jgi:hypothetical protein
MSMATQDRERQPREGRFSPMRALNERRIDPGTLSRENVDTPSPLSKPGPKESVRAAVGKKLP